MTISSNTIVKNGMPFIGKVLEQVAPYMEKMLVTISEKSDDGTICEVDRIYQQYPDKIIVDFENVTHKSELASVQQKQADRTESDWILFLSDDDYWTADQLEKCLKELEKNPETLAYSVSPYQLIDEYHYDASWRKKSFSKFLRKGFHYQGPWPRELPCDGSGKPLYWKTHPLVKTLPYRYYHLSYLKNHSFRNEEWASRYKFQKGNPELLPKPVFI